MALKDGDFRFTEVRLPLIPYDVARRLLCAIIRNRKPTQYQFQRLAFRDYPSACASGGGPEVLAAT